MVHTASIKSLQDTVKKQYNLPNEAAWIGGSRPKSDNLPFTTDVYNIFFRLAYLAGFSSSKVSSGTVV